AAQLGVTAAAILRHFPTKQDLFAAAMTGRDVPLPPPLVELSKVSGDEDPRVVLRRFAEQFVPFVSMVIRPAIAVHMHMAAQQTTVVVPFDTSAEETPPRRGLRILADYFKRAMDAGTIRRGDPRGLALLFAGQLQGYVFMHFVLNVTPTYPLGKYVDALLDLWSEGAIAGGTREKSDSDRRPRRAGDGGVRVHARAAKAEAARPRRNARGADGERGVARRRPRRPRSRR
ncbi:MAG TPA: TetR/AcrR family transcriptional regulator, partial [Thermoanaerobaculia bacterium]|nr:TetR/AcrR family transcriptional regulator [Thermoanaerobaculia bacterium]